MEIIKCNCVTKTPEFQYHKPSCPHRLSEENKILKEALEYYAEGLHILGERTEFDSVSGEPNNALWHDELPIGFENGDIAAYALRRCSDSKSI